MRPITLSALALLTLVLGCENAGGVLTGDDDTSAGDDDSITGDDDTSAGDDDSVGDDDDSVGDDDDDDDDDNGGSPWEGEWPVTAALYVQWGGDGGKGGPGGGGGDDAFCEAELVLIVDAAGNFEGEGDCERDEWGGGPGGGGPAYVLRFEGEVDDNGDAEGEVEHASEWGDSTDMDFEGAFGDPEDDMLWLSWSGQMQLGWDEQDVFGEAYTD